jgi:hypothetical protein
MSFKRYSFLVFLSALWVFFAGAPTLTLAQNDSPAMKKFVKQLEQKQERYSQRLNAIEEVGREINRIQKWRKAGSKGKRPTFDKSKYSSVMSREKNSRSLKAWQKKWANRSLNSEQESIVKVDELLNALRIRYKWLEKKWDELDHQIKNPAGYIAVIEEKDKRKQPPVDPDGGLLRIKTEKVVRPKLPWE